MAAPYPATTPFATTPLIDDATGADATPPSANWAALAAVGATSLSLTSKLFQSASGDRAMYWTPTVFNANMESWFEMVTPPTAGGIDIYLRVQNPTSTTTNAGYDCNYNSNTHVVQPSWMHGATFTPIAPTVSVTFAAGDWMGAAIIGGQITMWRKPAGGQWALLGVWTDANVTGPGTVAFECSETTSRFRNVGAGNPTLPVAPSAMPKGV